MQVTATSQYSGFFSPVASATTERLSPDFIKRKRLKDNETRVSTALPYVQSKEAFDYNSMTTPTTVGSSSTQRFEPLLDSREAAAMLHIHHKTLERKARGGEISGYQIAGRWYFRASELDDWLRSRVNSLSQSRRVN
ncbi:MAG: hypothetical protein C5B55_07420 [Blastocatellia bacterium]|nr:MAG: hypothetical protein C5B55_07420 [Blastocatellia bacterium]